MLIKQGTDWEGYLIAAISNELDQLKHLINDKSGATEKGDVHAQLSRICGLTDLANNERIPFSEPTKLEIQALNEMAMGMIRNTRDLSPPCNERLQDWEHEAAQGLFDAIAFNIPQLAQAEANQYAIALSMNAFDLLRKHMGGHPDFEMIARLVLVQDFRVMKLAGDNR